jgi:acetyl esterase/lipase
MSLPAPDHGYVPAVPGGTSLRAKAFIAGLRLARRKQTFADLRKLHQSFERRQRPQDGAPPAALRKRVVVTDHEVRGRPCYTLRPRAGRAERHVLYLHGGAYVHQIQPDHWSFLARLVERTGAAVTAPLYPLAPTYHHDDTIPMVRDCYHELLAGVDPADQVIMGDSAGGGLSVVLARSLRDEGRPQPKDIVLISPWLDITMTDPHQPELDRHDPYLAIPGLREAGRLYAGSLDPNDPLVSPINGDFRGLGRLSVFVGTRDVLLADARRLRAVGAEQGVPVDHREYDGMFHVWVTASIPEGHQATAEIADIVTRAPAPVSPDASR